ncbi:glutamate ligase domain-containing protein, partial [Hydrocarboniphaga effusa]
NALAAIAIGLELGVSVEAIRKAFLEFQGIGRRCEPHGLVALPKGGSALVVDDYGHHPREIAATFQAMRAAHPQRRLVVAFQPHRYTRTRDLFDDFCLILSEADGLLLTEVYAAGEEQIANADSRSLARCVRSRGKVEPVFVKTVADLPDALAGVLQDGDLLLTLGAGDIGGLPATLIKQFGVPA